MLTTSLQNPCTSQNVISSVRRFIRKGVPAAALSANIPASVTQDKHSRAKPANRSLVIIELVVGLACFLSSVAVSEDWSRLMSFKVGFYQFIKKGCLE